VTPMNMASNGASGETTDMSNTELHGPSGLRKGQAFFREAQLARLRLYHAEFRRLNTAHHGFLETVAELEEERASRHSVDPLFVKRSVVRVLSDVHAMVESINVISGDRYVSLRPAFQRIADTLAEALEESAQPLSYLPGVELLDKAISLISPLNLTDPDSAAFTPENSVTPRDLARFVHEKSCKEMLMMGSNVGDLRSICCRLDVFPSTLYVVDLGGGLEEEPKRRTLERSQIASVPFSALLTGMFDEKISPSRPGLIDTRATLSGTRVKISKLDSMKGPITAPGFAIVSDKYLNLTSGIGDHYTVLDSYCSETATKNYIAFSFNGGPNDRSCSNRDAEALAENFRSLDFSVAETQNRVCARFHQQKRTAIEAKLDMIGRMFTM